MAVAMCLHNSGEAKKGSGSSFSHMNPYIPYIDLCKWAKYEFKNNARQGKTLIYIHVYTDIADSDSA